MTHRRSRRSRSPSPSPRPSPSKQTKFSHVPLNLTDVIESMQNVIRTQGEAVQGLQFMAKANALEMCQLKNICLDLTRQVAWHNIRAAQTNVSLKTHPSMQASASNVITPVPMFNHTSISRNGKTFQD